MSIEVNIYEEGWEFFDGTEMEERSFEEQCIGDGDNRHETVNHSQDEYVRGGVHTNTVEGVWCLLKRSIIRAFHYVSIKHLDKYLSELEWRYGDRNNTHIFRNTMRELVKAENLEYKELTA